MDRKDRIAELIRKLKDSSREVRYAAAWELGDIGPEASPAVQVLIEALKEDSDRLLVPYAAARALGRIGPDASPAVQLLIEALKDESDFSLREAAARALGEIGDLAAVPALMQALNDRVPAVCATAAHALRLIGLSVPSVSAE